MTDEELIAQLREGATWDDDIAAVDLMLALVKHLANTQADFAEQLGNATAYQLRMIDAEARVERLEDALKRARDFIERGGRDRIGPVLRQIDAALKGDQK